MLQWIASTLSKREIRYFSFAGTGKTWFYLFLKFIYLSICNIYLLASFVYDYFSVDSDAELLVHYIDAYKHRINSWCFAASDREDSQRRQRHRGKLTPFTSFLFISQLSS